jgi:RimJ/RimL family protein N-acetyltransferase
VECLPSGEEVHVRPVRISDEGALQHLLYQLSDESTFLRFFGHSHRHPQREVLRMVEIDDACSIALVASLPDTEELLGIARADMDPRSGAGELGLSVAEAWQGKRIGSLLLEQLVPFAGRRGFRSLVAQVLPSNTRMQRLLRRQGFSCTGEPGGPLTFRLPLTNDEA